MGSRSTSSSTYLRPANTSLLWRYAASSDAQRALSVNGQLLDGGGRFRE